MAGRGPAPKASERRARRNADPVAARVIEVSPEAQPELPELMPSREPWPEATRTWWRMWAESPLSADFTANDWSELLDAAVLHGTYWSGSTSVAAELRLRVAKFGATPEDRARLRITFAQADEADERRTVPAQSAARTRRGPLKAV